MSIDQEATKIEDHVVGAGKRAAERKETLTKVSCIPFTFSISNSEINYKN